MRQAQPAAGASARPRRTNLRHGLACSECERARKRCDGQRPCERCDRMGKTCVDGKAALRRQAKAASKIERTSAERAPKRAASRMDPAPEPVWPRAHETLPSRCPPPPGAAAAAAASAEPSMRGVHDGHFQPGKRAWAPPSDLAWRTPSGASIAGLPGSQAGIGQQVFLLPSPALAMSPRVRLFDAPLWSPQGIAAWSRVMSCATDSGRLGQLESGIRHLMESTPGASARLGVPFRVTTLEGRYMAPHELPPGHHVAHSCAKVGLAAGGAFSASSFSGLRGRTVRGLPLGFDDVVEVALSSSPIPVVRSVYDDVTEFPIT